MRAASSMPARVRSGSRRTRPGALSVLALAGLGFFLFSHYPNEQGGGPLCISPASDVMSSEIFIQTVNNCNSLISIWKAHGTPPASRRPSSARTRSRMAGRLPSEQALIDATRVVIHTQEQAGIDLVCDGELYRFDVNHPETNGMIEYFVRPMVGIRAEIRFAELFA